MSRGAVPDLIVDDPCILFALRREAGPFLAEFKPQERFPGAPCWARFCGPPWLSVLVLETGPGIEAMDRALSWLQSEPRLDNLPYRPKLVLSAGFAGGLSPALEVGDLVLATEVGDEQGTIRPTTWPGELPPGEWRPPLHRGRLHSASELLATPARKRAVAEQHDAIAVDMESAALARYGTRNGIPWGCLRAVSDDAQTALSPELASILKGGHVSWLKLVALLLRKPGIYSELRHLAANTRLAAQQLGTALGELLTLTLAWARES